MTAMNAFANDLAQDAIRRHSNPSGKRKRTSRKRWFTTFHTATKSSSRFDSAAGLRVAGHEKHIPLCWGPAVGWREQSALGIIAGPLV